MACAIALANCCLPFSLVSSDMSLLSVINPVSTKAAGTVVRLRTIRSERFFTPLLYVPTTFVTYFVFVARAAIGGLTKKILDTMGNLVGQKVGNGDYLDTFIGKRAYVDYMRKFTDMTGEILNADKIGNIVMSIEEEFGGKKENKSASATVGLTIEIFNNITEYFK